MVWNLGFKKQSGKKICRYVIYIDRDIHLKIIAKSVLEWGSKLGQPGTER